MKNKIFSLCIVGIFLVISLVTTSFDTGAIATINNEYMPDPPSKPEGPKKGFCNSEYEFNTTAVDPSPDKVLYYQWDFGDGSIVDWSERMNSGWMIRQGHSWEKPGIYEIKVRCKNNYSISNWSESIEINISIQNFAPTKPVIHRYNYGETDRLTNLRKYKFYFISIDPECENISYFIDWGDGSDSGWIGPFDNNEEIILTHRWLKKGDYTIKAKAKDEKGHESGWSFEEINLERYRVIDLIIDILNRIFQRN